METQFINAELQIIDDLIKHIGSATSEREEEEEEEEEKEECFRRILGVVNKAIEIGATPDFNKSSLFALACERDASLVKMMIQHGAFPNSRISVGWELRRPLNIASEEGAMEVVKVLVENGADVNGTDASEHVRWWPLLLACRGGYFGVATFLLQRGSKVDLAFISSLCLIFLHT